MKKLLITFSIILSTILFATPKDGNYEIIMHEKDWTPNLTLRIKNSKIILIKYDRKDSRGQSLSMTDENFREKISKLSKTRDINSIPDINDSSITNEFKKLLKTALDKAELGEVGKHIIE